ncbi:AEC family transporter [Pseudomonas sp. EL_65y_Pfl2_R95]|uniref:AEC family transporter n=1 Tax=Pseudomonas sp. EL_65y_Pfl2_R95 TaxID=3088698 RepID=UPI0030DD374C
MPAVLAILPIFGLIVLGYLLGWRQWLTAEAAAGLATITFKLFLPMLLFTGIAKAPLADGLSLTLLLAYFLPVALIFSLVNLVVQRQQGRATPLGLAAVFSNNVLVGIPIVTTLMGHDGLVHLFAILVVHSLILFSMQSFYAAFGSPERVNVVALLKSLANPIIIGLLAGALLNASGWSAPEPLWKMVSWLGQAALPCALIVLGASLSRFRLRPSSSVLVLTVIKLMVFPALVWWFSGLLPHLNDGARAVLVIMAGCPSGVNILGFAKTQDDVRSVSSTVFLSTVLSALTLPVWVLLVI